MNQTTQMHQRLSEYYQAFSPYYFDGINERLRRLALTPGLLSAPRKIPPKPVYLSLNDRCKPPLDDYFPWQSQTGPVRGKIILQVGN